MSDEAIHLPSFIPLGMGWHEVLNFGNSIVSEELGDQDIPMTLFKMEVTIRIRPIDLFHISSSQF